MSPIIIYTSLDCPYSVMAKSYLDKKGIDYKEYNLSHNSLVKENLFKHFGEVGTPLIIVGDEAFVGFDREGIESAIIRLS
ncbi:MAG: glutaredoxin family protein [Patescibacteria group bacterium]